MNIEGKLNQICVHWAKTGVDEFGIPTYDDPVEIICRWEDKTEQFLGLKGENELSRAKVYSLREMRVGRMRCLGTIETIPEGEDIRTFASNIRSYKKIPDLQADEYLRVALL